MASPLPFVEIPGLRDAIRREQELRDFSFLGFPEDIAGIPVRPYTLRDLLALDAMKNGFVVDYVFESELERVVQAMQFLWFMSTSHRLPRNWPDRFWMSWRQARFIHRVSKMNAEVVISGVEAYLKEAWYDNPYSSDGDTSSTLKASFVVYIIDLLYSAAYPWTEREILAMPVKKLWQYVRIATNRLDPKQPLANRSDRLAVDFIAKQDAVAAGAAGKEVRHA